MVNADLSSIDQSSVSEFDRLTRYENYEYVETEGS